VPKGRSTGFTEPSINLLATNVDPDLVRVQE
jgi:hypothetical protein